MKLSLRIYISSTYEDLASHRRALYEQLRRLGHEVTAMEDYVAADRRPIDKCLEDVDACDACIGLLARRYGYVPLDDNPKGLSVTELEYEAAEGKRLMFLLDETAVWPPKHDDVAAGKGKAIRRFRQRAEKEVVRARFTTKDNLLAAVYPALEQFRQSFVSRQSTVPRQMPYLVDRQDQRRGIRDLLDRVEPHAGALPLILHGDDDQGHGELIEVLRDNDANLLFKLSHRLPVKEYVLSWPRDLSPKDFRRHMFDELARVSGPQLRGDEPAIQRAVNRHPGPVLVHTHVAAEALRAQGGQRIVERFRSFWNAWPPKPKHGPLLSFLCIKYPTTNRWLRAWRDRALKNRMQSVLLKTETPAVLAEMVDVTKSQAFEWALLPEVKRIAASVDLKAGIRKQFGNEDAMPMETLMEGLGDLLEEKSYGFSVL